jgi:hypothetical protein
MRGGSGFCAPNSSGGGTDGIPSGSRGSDGDTVAGTVSTEQASSTEVFNRNMHSRQDRRGEWAYV